MEVVLIVVSLIIVVVVILIFLIKLINQNIKLNSKLNDFEGLINNSSLMQGNIESNLNKSLVAFGDSLNNQFYRLNQNVDNKLNISFNRTNETMSSIKERLVVVDEAQKKIEGLSSNIISLQSILSDKSARGVFGEVQLKNILNSIFGENSNLYKMQYTFDNNSRVDAVVFAAEPINIIGIDSKFPLENYRNYIDTTSDSEERLYRDIFKKNVKKHIDDIANKYIIAGTTTQAIMFIPAEAIFAHIYSQHLELVEYANQRNVWLTSPTTLTATLTIIQVVVKNVERDKYTKIIASELDKLSNEFTRFEVRFDKLNRTLKTLNTDVNDISITSNKINKRFNDIHNMEFNLKE